MQLYGVFSRFLIHFLFLALDFIPHPLNGALFLITVKTYIRDNGQKKERKVFLGGGVLIQIFLREWEIFAIGVVLLCL